MPSRDARFRCPLLGFRCLRVVSSFFLCRSFSGFTSHFVTSLLATVRLGRRFSSCRVRRSLSDDELDLLPLRGSTCLLRRLTCLESERSRCSAPTSVFRFLRTLSLLSVECLET